jgi:homogentisate phytyltransferase / homogentisate geranylgeranyltransferase
MQIDQTFVFGRPAVFSRPLIFATGFMTFFSVVIALFKVTALLL